jgi:hypothetical protein
MLQRAQTGADGIKTGVGAAAGSAHYLWIRLLARSFTTLQVIDLKQ